ncbi:Protein CBG27750 [Caenorhabditis briggsae]|uniref:Protein CBG27750 n=1 Tax=Caenorhabditis briggsae TaxID=6238 RepID=B6IJ48_CAEBR|nr:Protein CBG27750 [Caenorhabditis briggsae]CAS00028.1 Protein CBG27750 [Caenorhabditis briggsae]
MVECANEMLNDSECRGSKSKKKKKEAAKPQSGHEKAGVECIEGTRRTSKRQDKKGDDDGEAESWNRETLCQKEEYRQNDNFQI